MTKEALKYEDMDVVGALFGMRKVPGGAPDGLIELYIEDDENYLYQCSFNHLWLADLSITSLRMKEQFSV